MDDRKAILGVTWRFGAESVGAFVRSARCSGYNGKLVLFAAGTAPADVAAMRRTCDVIEVDGEYPPLLPASLVWLLTHFKTTRGLRRHYPRAFRAVGRLLRVGPGSAKATDLEYRLQGLQSLRYRHYLAYLEAHPEVEVAMISDVRDVVFQGDPFVDVRGLEVYMEEPGTAFAHRGFNRTWIEDLYGAAVRDEMVGKLASCSGVTIGSRAEMLAYLRAMDAEVSRHLIPMGPHDQGVHNYLLHSGAFPFAQQIQNGSGRVATLSLLDDIRLDESGRVLNPDGTVPAVVHQYDRFGWLADAIHRRLASAREEC